MNESLSANPASTRSSRSRTCRSPSSPARGEIPAVMDFSCAVDAGRGAGHRRRIRLRQVDRGARQSCATSPRSAGSSAARSGSRAATWATMSRRGAAPASAATKIAMIYQEPMASLNPAMKVGQQLMEVPMIHDKVSTRARPTRGRCEMVRGGAPARSRAHDALLSAPALRRPAAAHRHRHGADVEAGAAHPRRADDGARRDGRGRHRRAGQGSRPRVRHLDALRLATISGWCWRPATASRVMYSGEAVETGPIEDVFDRMRHPYTQGLFRSIPLPGADKNCAAADLDPRATSRCRTSGRQGCNFGPRCQLFRRRAAATPPRSR